MAASTPFLEPIPRAMARMDGVASPMGPPDAVKMFGRKTAPPPPRI